MGRHGKRNLFLAGLIGFLVGGWLFFDFSGQPPKVIWVWSTRDAAYPTDKRSLETPYQAPGGIKLPGWIARMDAAEASLPPGLSLRATPGFREKVLVSMGIRPAVLGRWHAYLPTAHSAGSSKGTFWKLERRK